MSTAELKNILHKLVVETDDNEVLLKVKEIFFALKSNETDWYDFISDDEKKLIEKGLYDAEHGKLFSHGEVREEVEKWIKKRKSNE